MGYSGETNDINFSSGTTAFYGFLGFLINGESTNGAGLSESNVQMPFSPGTISLLWCPWTSSLTSTPTAFLHGIGLTELSLGCALVLGFLRQDVRQADEHMIAVPGPGGLNLLLTERQETYKTLTKEQQRFWKRILIVDDDADLTMTFRAVIEDSNNDVDVNKRIEVYTSNDPVVALSDFKPNFYDLLLVDINMPQMNGFELCEKILAIDINVRVCFMSTGEINREALREIYPTRQEGCFIRKPVSIDYLIKCIRSELD
jgi:CheY-like chemotaxis protein